MNLQDFAELKALELAKKLFVILVEFKNGDKTIIKDPGMDQPWHTKNKKLADDNARLYEQRPEIVKAAAMTLEEAFAILQRHFADTNKLKFKL